MTTTSKELQAKADEQKAKQDKRAMTFEKVEYELNRFSERFTDARHANEQSIDPKSWAALKRAAADLKDALTDITFSVRGSR